MKLQKEDYTTLVRLSEIVSFAEFLSIETVSIRNTEPIYPVTVGEKIACYALDIALLHEWSSTEAEYVSEPLIDALQQLDTGVDRPDTWHSLFIANDALKTYIENAAFPDEK
jgi:hypothetical protein